MMTVLWIVLGLLGLAIALVLYAMATGFLWNRYQTFSKPKKIAVWIGWGIVAYGIYALVSHLH